MRYLIILVIFNCLVVRTRCRPTADEGNDSDAVEKEYDGDDEAALDDSVHNAEDSATNERETNRFNQEDMSRNRRLMDLGEKINLQRSKDDRLLNRNVDEVSDYKFNRHEDRYENTDGNLNSNNEFRGNLKRQQSNRYIDNIEANEQTEAAQHLTNRDVPNYNKISRARSDMPPNNPVNKRTIEANEEGELLFGNEKSQDERNKGDKSEYSNEGMEANEQSPYIKQYYNNMAENKASMDDRSDGNVHFNINRDRRQAQEADQRETMTVSEASIDKKSLEDSSSEDEESAIKRHIKKLSSEELEELLNSLSEDKRALLKRIIDTDSSNNLNHINKREITKKSGAVEENSYVENSQSDSSKIQSGSPSAESINTDTSMSQSSDTTEPSKQTEVQTDTNDISNTKSADTSNHSESLLNKAELVSRTDEANSKKMDALNSGTSETLNDVSTGSKIENKREINLRDSAAVDSTYDDTKMVENDLSAKGIDESSQNQGYFCSQDEDLSQLMDDESQLHSDEDKNVYKRETFLDNNSMKSLQESFPNSNSYDEADPYFGSDMAPLVRVKRRNADLVVKKRAAALMPDAKVAYFPYRAENDEEDSDEGNEFDDDGFYDRTANFAKSDNKHVEEDVTANKYDVRSYHPKDKASQNEMNQAKETNENMESDTMSLGSDTDSVLSGVEGVDDNLMYSSGSRKRRNAKDSSKEGEEVEGNLSLRASQLLNNEMKYTSDGNMRGPNYQENEAFGPLPHNYDIELGRYKRIRRVKQVSTSGNAPRTNTT